MSIQTQIDRISESVSAALTALTEKGVTVPDGTKVDGLAALIAAIESGGGGATIATGSFSPNWSNPNFTVTHGLGVVPNFAIIYRQMKTTTLARNYAIIFAAKIGNEGMLCGKNNSALVGGEDTSYAITDTPTEYAPFVGAYGATTQKITFGFNYDSSRGDVYYCFEAGWYSYDWIVGVL